MCFPEAGKCFFWFPLWGDRICKMRPFPKRRMSMQKTWAVRRLYKERATHRHRARCWGRAVSRGTCSPCLCSFHFSGSWYLTFNCKKRDSLKWFNLYYERRTYADSSTIYLSIITCRKLQIMYSRFWCGFPISSYWELVNFTKVIRKTALSGTTSGAFPLLFTFCGSSLVNLTQHSFHTMIYSRVICFYQSRQFCYYVCNCPKFIFILKSIHWIARVALLSISTQTSKCLPCFCTLLWTLSVCLASSHSLFWLQ